MDLLSPLSLRWTSASSYQIIAVPSRYTMLPNLSLRRNGRSMKDSHCPINAQWQSSTNTWIYSSETQPNRRLQSTTPHATTRNTMSRLTLTLSPRGNRTRMASNPLCMMRLCPRLTTLGHGARTCPSSLQGRCSSTPRTLVNVVTCWKAELLASALRAWRKRPTNRSNRGCTMPAPRWTTSRRASSRT